MSTVTVSSLLNVTLQKTLISYDIVDLHILCLWHTVAALGSFQPWQTAEKQGEARGVRSANSSAQRTRRMEGALLQALKGRAWLEHVKRDDVYQKKVKFPKACTDNY